MKNQQDELLRLRDLATAWETLAGKRFDQFRKAETEILRLREECERLQGIIDDTESVSGLSMYLDDAENEPPSLPDHVASIVRDRDRAVQALRNVRDDRENDCCIIIFGEDAEAVEDLLARHPDADRRADIERIIDAGSLPQHLADASTAAEGTA